MKKTTIMTTLATVAILATSFAATFESIPFNTPTYSDGDPLGVNAIVNTSNKVVEVEATASNAVEAATTAQYTADAAQAVATEAAQAASNAQTTADTATNSITTIQTKTSDIETSLNTFKESITNAVTTTTNGTVVVGSMKGTPEDVGMLSKENAIVFGVNRDSDELEPANGQILMSADSIKFDTGLGSIFIGDATLESLLQGGGSGESNTIVTVKTNGVALVPDSNRAIDITIPAPTEISLDGKLDATNGVAFGDLKVYPMPSGTVGQTHTIITHESISIGNVEYKEDGITYNGESYEFGSDTNGLARFKDIPTISTNGVVVAPDANKNVNITIPSPGEGNVIESITTNGVALPVNGKSVEIPLQDYVKLSDLQDGITFDNMTVSNLTINGKKPSLEGHTHTVSEIDGLDSYKNPTISAAALTAIDGIVNAEDIATIKSSLTNFLHQFVIPAP